MKFTRKHVVAAAVVLMLVPALVWWALLSLGYVGAPGDPIEPPFNLSDRIVTIEVIESDGEYRARFDGWEEGDPEMGSEEFFAEIHGRKRDLPRLYGWLDVTSLTGVLWVAFGFAGQAVFMGRMIAQWQASEKVRSSVVPPIFWWLSLLGSSMLMVYFIWRKEIVGFLGQSTGWFIYLRNLWFIYGNRRKR
ncbi:MAG: lipid-A-disaccharide synthase N-terminal domain-containing protein [Verrucomicrobiales bacterium]